uniref:Allergen Bos d 2-like n=1 Tax=Camelus bactrianus TaxID=9837 RepID=A0A9W3H7B3_CAMBA
MKTLLLRLVLGVLCAAQITGEWHTIYTASDNVQKIQENGSLRGYSHRTECSNGCKTLSITYYIKWNLPKFSGKNYFQLIHVSKNMLVIYAENIDGDETTHLTEVTAKGRDLNEAEYKKFEELPKDKGVLTENTEHVISTGTPSESTNEGKPRVFTEAEETRCVHTLRTARHRQEDAVIRTPRSLRTTVSDGLPGGWREA